MNFFEKLKIAINGLLFYFGWFIVMLYAAAGSPLLAVMLGIFVILFHFIWCVNRRHELMQMCIILGIGLVVETLFIQNGLLVYHSRLIALPLPPLWVLSIYGIFSTTLNYSMIWIKKIPILAILSGGIGGALSYRAGLYMNAVSFPMGVPWTLLMIGGTWAILFPFFCWISTRVYRI